MIQPQDPTASFAFDAPQDSSGEVVVEIDTTSDPRPDLGQGAPLWADLLRRAAAIDGNQILGLYGILRGLRSSGAYLALRPSGGARLLAGEMTEAEYAQMREKFLAPYAEVLTEILAQVRV